MVKIIVSLVIILMLLSRGDGIAWQGVGNLSKENRTVIWAYIDEKFDLNWNGYTPKSTIGDFAAGLSDNLTALWDAAWNVVVTIDVNGTQFDTVVYGYAFRDHWMWYNGFKRNDDKYTSFVIWKDYNCLGNWFSGYQATGTVTFTGSASSAITTTMASFRNADSPVPMAQLWQKAQEVHTILHAQPQLTGMEFTVIATAQTLHYFLKVCALNIAVFTPLSYVTWDGQGIIFQMR